MVEILNTTESRIESIEYENDLRDYLGFSSIGGCISALWFSFRFCSKPPLIPIRKKRIFERGKLEEKRIIKELKSVGIFIYQRYKGINFDEDIEIFGDEANQEEILGFAGHAKGHPDGRCRGVIEAPKTDHLLEMKTMADKYFQELKRNGLAKSQPGYLAQCIRSMDAMKLKRTLFISVNKNDESHYYERLRIEDYNLLAEELKLKEKAVILSEIPIPPQYPSGFWKCKFCVHDSVCHRGHAPQITCRTCKHVDILDDGKWSCSKHDKELSTEEQLKACEYYKRIF